MVSYTKNHEDDLVVYEIPTPHPPEIDAFQRSSLKFFVSEPMSGVNAETVPLLALHGDGAAAGTDYMKSLHRSIASKRNALVVSVDYLGTRVMRHPNPSGLMDERKIDEWTLQRMNSLLQSKGLPPIPVKELAATGDLGTALMKYLRPYSSTPDSRLLCLTGIARGEHYDFGLIQAMDCLWAIRVLKGEYPGLRWDRLAASGLSHGGYLSTMCAKFAPNTFALIVNAYGWTGPYLPWMIKGRMPFAICVNGLYGSLFLENYWSEDPASPYFLSPDRIAIRDLGDAGQLDQWKTQRDETGTNLVFTHQVDDEMHPRAAKERMLETMRSLGFEFEYHARNDPAKGIDYRSLSQGEKTSAKGVIYDFVTEDRLAKARVTKDDFERHSKIEYRCAKTRYVVDYADDGFPRVKVEVI
jgi:hypothetical protein